MQRCYLQRRCCYLRRQCLISAAVNGGSAVICHRLQSQTTIHSDKAAIYSDKTTIYSDSAAIYSDKTAFHRNNAAIYSDTAAMYGGRGALLQRGGRIPRRRGRVPTGVRSAYPADVHTGAASLEDEAECPQVCVAPNRPGCVGNGVVLVVSIDAYSTAKQYPVLIAGTTREQGHYCLGGFYDKATCSVEPGTKSTIGLWAYYEMSSTDLRCTARSAYAMCRTDLAYGATRLPLSCPYSHE
eukprot:1086859-Rhodomonas_salina.2